MMPSGRESQTGGQQDTGRQLGPTCSTEDVDQVQSLGTAHHAAYRWAGHYAGT